MDFLGITIGAAVTFVLVRHIRKTRAYERFWLEKAEIAFKESSIRSSSENLSFSGLDAKIIDEKREVEASNGSLLAFQVTRVAVNPQGEYFWFLFRSDSAPIIKHLNKVKAKAILGEKYGRTDA
tara:strand:- start:439 stop:810 length:372 start_codon:yes stop_codon:yes gene_type:complete